MNKQKGLARLATAKGFSVLAIILIIAGVIVIGGASYWLGMKTKPAQNITQQPAQSSSSSSSVSVSSSSSANSTQPSISTTNLSVSIGGQVELSGSNINNSINDIYIDGAKLLAGSFSGYSIVDTNSIAFFLPISIVAGSHTLQVANSSGKSNTITFTVTSSNSTQPSITVTSPNGGEVWKQGIAHNITWRATGVNNVRISIADFQTGLNIEHTIANVPASNGLYSWTVPSDNNYLPLGNTYRIAISSTDDTGPSYGYLVDTSDKPFTIAAPANDPSSITVTSPNGGETWKIGETKNITWQVNRVSMVDISVKDMTGKTYSIDQGIKFSGSFSWFVGRYSGGYLFPPGQYKIEIKNTYAGAGTPPDISNNYFTVADAEFVNGVCGPVNGTRVSVSPTNNLCSSGIASSVMGSEGVYSWLCYGAGGGATVACSANFASN